MRRYKIVANQTIMEENITAGKAMNAICGIVSIRQPGERLEVKVYYLNNKGEWKLENQFVIAS